MGQPRISDVAQAAGVSASTVSLVLNDAPSRISAVTRLRVREAAEKIGYRPSSLARGLRTRQTRTVGLISDQIATTPFAGRMLAGAQDAARENGRLLLLVDTAGDPAVERDSISALAAHQVDAMIYASMYHRVVPAPEGLVKETVFLDCRPSQASHSAVVPDDQAGGRAAVRELIAAGHRRIAYVDSNESGVLASGLRLTGYREALAAAGLEADPALHVRGDTTALGGRTATDELLDLPAEKRPTAVFAFNDRMAAGVYVAAHRRGLRIPQDLSVVGYDDQQLVAAELDPPLTTIALPHYEMGRWAMETVLGVNTVKNGTVHRMECPVVRRESVGPPPAKPASIDRRRA